MLLVAVGADSGSAIRRSGQRICTGPSRPSPANGSDEREFERDSRNAAAAVDADICTTLNGCGERSIVERLLEGSCRPPVVAIAPPTPAVGCSLDWRREHSKARFK